MEKPEAAPVKPPAEVVKRLSQLPVMKIKAGPRDGDLWLQRLEEEYKCLIKVRIERRFAAQYLLWRYKSGLL